MMINNEMNSPSLKKLVEGELAYNMDKDFQMSDWRVRPLLKEMVDYARMDAEILLYLFAKLTHAADKKGMIRQVQEQCFKERKLNLKGKHLEITLEK
jgi:ribonuclease D